MAHIPAPESTLSINDAVELLWNTKINRSILGNSNYTMKIFSFECKKLLNTRDLPDNIYFEWLRSSTENIEKISSEYLKDDAKDTYLKILISILDSVAYATIGFNRLTTRNYFRKNSKEIAERYVTDHISTIFSAELDNRIMSMYKRAIAGYIIMVCEFWIAFEELHVDDTTKQFITDLSDTIHSLNDDRLVIKFK